MQPAPESTRPLPEIHESGSELQQEIESVDLMQPPPESSSPLPEINETGLESQHEPGQSADSETVSDATTLVHQFIRSNISSSDPVQPPSRINTRQRSVAVIRPSPRSVAVVRPNPAVRRSARRRLQPANVLEDGSYDIPEEVSPLEDSPDEE